MVALLHYDWPLNVRELRSCIEDGVRHTAEGQPLDKPHLPAAIFERSQAYGEGACAAGLPRSSMTRGSVPLRRRSK
jgi:DNA-binding NtrC family response regulator